VFRVSNTVAVSSSDHTALRPIAIFEAFKGAAVLIAGFGMLSFLGRDADVFAEHLVHRMHLDPANHYPQIFIQAMTDLTNKRLWLMAGFAALYATIRFVEAYGLWHARRWAEWFAAFSGSIYVPVEIYELAKKFSWLKATTLILNLVVVVYMVWLLTESQRRRTAAAKNA
jgi:uncharacterized membrane protein (DUF2068 family)